MKQDIRGLFSKEGYPKKKLPHFHREEFFEKLQKQRSKKPNRNKLFFIVKVAASIVLVVSITYLLNINDKISPKNEIKIVKEIIDTTNVKQRKKLLEIVPNEKLVLEKSKIDSTNLNLVNEELLISNKRIRIQTIGYQKAKIIVLNSAEKPKNLDLNLVLNNTSIGIVSNERLRIKVDSDALLYSITHTPKEILAYYKENDLTRESVLLAIEEELEKSNLEVDANELLAEIELGLHRNSFKRNLLDNIKIKIKDLSKALANN